MNKSYRIMRVIKLCILLMLVVTTINGYKICVTIEDESQPRIIENGGGFTYHEAVGHCNNNNFKSCTNDNDCYVGIQKDYCIFERNYAVQCKKQQDNSQWIVSTVLDSCNKIHQYQSEGTEAKNYFILSNFCDPGRNVDIKVDCSCDTTSNYRTIDISNYVGRNGATCAADEFFFRDTPVIGEPDENGEPPCIQETTDENSNEPTSIKALCNVDTGEWSVTFYNDATCENNVLTKSGQVGECVTLFDNIGGGGGDQYFRLVQCNQGTVLMGIAENKNDCETAENFLIPKDACIADNEGGANKVSCSGNSFTFSHYDDPNCESPQPFTFNGNQECANPSSDLSLSIIVNSCDARSCESNADCSPTGLCRTPAACIGNFSDKNKCNTQSSLLPRGSSCSALNEALREPNTLCQRSLCQSDGLCVVENKNDGTIVGNSPGICRNGVQQCFQDSDCDDDFCIRAYNLVCDSGAVAIEFTTRVNGDPHFTTLDNYFYSFQNIGEYKYCEYEKSNIKIHTCLKPEKSSNSASIVEAVAIENHGSTLAVVLIDDNFKWFLDENDISSTIPNNIGDNVIANDKISIRLISNNIYRIFFQSSNSIDVHVWSDFLNIRLNFKRQVRLGENGKIIVEQGALTSGLCGNFNLDPQDDSQMDFNSFKMSSSESLFHSSVYQCSIDTSYVPKTLAELSTDTDRLQDATSCCEQRLGNNPSVDSMNACKFDLLASTPEDQDINCEANEFAKQMNFLQNNCNNNECINGECINGECNCYFGYSGDNCGVIDKCANVQCNEPPECGTIDGVECVDGICNYKPLSQGTPCGCSQNNDINFISGSSCDGINLFCPEVDPLLKCIECIEDANKNDQSKKYDLVKLCRSNDEVNRKINGRVQFNDKFNSHWKVNTCFIIGNNHEAKYSVCVKSEKKNIKEINLYSCNDFNDCNEPLDYNNDDIKCELLDGKEINCMMETKNFAPNNDQMTALDVCSYSPQKVKDCVVGKEAKTNEGKNRNTLASSATSTTLAVIMAMIVLIVITVMITTVLFYRKRKTHVANNVEGSQIELTV